MVIFACFEGESGPLRHNLDIVNNEIEVSYDPHSGALVFYSESKTFSTFVPPHPDLVPSFSLLKGATVTLL